MAPSVPSLLSRVRDQLHDLPPTERRLADLVLDFPGELASYTASELAALANVSNATVSRFIRRLGYENYDELKSAVVALQHAVWGVKGDNGINSDLRELTRKVDAWMEIETNRRETLAKEQRNRDRAVVIAALTSVAGMVGVIITLVIVLQGAAT